MKGIILKHKSSYNLLLAWEDIMREKKCSSILTLSYTAASIKVNTRGENHPELWMLFAIFIAPGGNVNT